MKHQKRQSELVIVKSLRIMVTLWFYINTLFLIPIVVVISSSPCPWPCRWTIAEQNTFHTLDLTPFQEMGLTATSNSWYGTTNFSYSPCNNNLYNTNYHKSPLQCMISYNDDPENGGSRCIAQISGNSTSNVVPTLYINSTDNEDVIWTFKYNTLYEYDSNCTVTVLWICNHTISEAPYFEINYAEMLVPRCLYELRIHSFVACLNNNILPPDSDKDKCFFVDRVTGFLILNLTELHGTTLFYEGTDNNGKTVIWSYSICQNNVNCSMAVGLSDTDFYQGYYPGWDMVTNYWNQPNTVATWEVTYGDGDEYYWSFSWLCGESEYKVLNVSFNTKYNSIEWFIESKYACVNQSELECVFKYGSNTLNLTYFVYTRIFGVDSNEIYSYLYNPCSNIYYACNDYSVMAYQYDINNERCSQYLAVWHGNNQDLDVFFDGNNKWEISYQSGQMCNNETFTNFDVHWTCNKTAGYWNVVTVRQINICAFEMYIESAYIC
eukprot:522433_1